MAVEGLVVFSVLITTAGATVVGLVAAGTGGGSFPPAVEGWAAVPVGGGLAGCPAAGGDVDGESDIGFAAEPLALGTVTGFTSGRKSAVKG